MMKVLWGALSVLASAACSAPQTVPAATEQELKSIGQLALAATPGGRLLAVCGPSDGRAYYVEGEKDEWVSDSISAGRIAFIEEESGGLQVLFRDAGGSFISARADGGVVNKVYEAADGGAFSAVVYYPGTGVSETFNVTRDLEGEKLALWTSNKPPMMIGAKVASFTARCI